MSIDNETDKNHFMAIINRIDKNDLVCVYERENISLSSACRHFTCINIFMQSLI